MNQFVKYIRATMMELRQVSWPSQRQATLYTILVLGICAIVALYVGFFDFLFSKMISSLITLI